MQNFKQNKCANLLSMSVLALLSTAVHAGGDGPAPKNHWKLHGNIDVNYGMWDSYPCSSDCDRQFFGLYNGFENQYNKLYVKGRYMDWGYRIGLRENYKKDINWPSNNARLDYTYIGYHGWDHRTKGGYTDGFEIRAGYMQALYGLNSSTPQDALVFAHNAFVSDSYGVENPYGVRVQGNTGAFTYSVTVASKQDTLTGSTTDKGNDPFYGGRLVYTGGGNHMLWHVGGSARFGQRNNDVASASEFDPYWNAEAAVQWNNFLVWGEYQDHKYKLNAGGKRVQYKGWYVSAAWLMDGKRGYNMRRATWKRVRPTSRRGAWEIAGSYLKNEKCYNDTPSGSECFDDGWSAAVNWYANRVVKLGVNYYNGDVAWDSDEKGVWWVQLSAAW